MHTITYTITTLAPVVIASRFGDMNLINTKQYIPGTSVLGLLAHRVLNHKHLSSAQALTDEHFHRWFLLGELHIGNAYIISYDEYEKKRMHFPTPLSIHHEKYYDKRIHDLLYVGEDFDEQTKYLRKFCAIEGSEIYTKHVETSLNFHHARDRETGTSKEGMIFTYEALAKNQTFEGEIRGNLDDLEKLIELCRPDTSEWIAYMGRSKNAQYGQIKVEFSTPQEYSLPVIQKQKPISFTLLSDTIIYNKHGFPTTDIQELLTYLPQAKLHDNKAIIKKGSVENFISVWRMKTPSETCFAAGSTFLLDISDCDVTRLAELELNGIGERTHEGFGRCKFGWQTPDIELGEISDEDMLLSKFPMTSQVKEILKTIAQDTFERSIEMIALQDLEEFKNAKRLPSSASFISRLQAIARNSGSQNLFTNKLAELIKRKPARDKLEACHNGKQTLLTFLSERPNPIKTVLQQPANGKLNTLCHDIGYDAKTDKELETALFHIYFNTFFAMMRKHVAKGGK